MDQSNQERNVSVTPKVVVSNVNKENLLPSKEVKSSIQKMKSYSTATDTTQPLKTPAPNNFKFQSSQAARSNSLHSKSLRSFNSSPMVI